MYIVIWQTGYIPNQRSSMTLQAPGCCHSRVIQHELLHVLGLFLFLNWYKSLTKIILDFYHEQSRQGRDQYLQIHLQNVEHDMVSQ